MFAVFRRRPWGRVIGNANLDKGTGLHGKQIEDCQSASHAEILHAQRAAMSSVRPATGRVPEIRDLPDLFPQSRGRRTYSRREKGELVKGPD